MDPVSILVGIAAGLVVGGILTWFLRSLAARGTEEELRNQIATRDTETAGLREQHTSEQKARIEAETELKAARQGFEEQRRLLEDAQKALKDAFDALAQKALKASKEDFLQLASESLGKREASIKGLVDPIRDTLRKYEEEVRKLEKERAGAYEKLYQELGQLRTDHSDLQKETGRLVTALQNPRVSGSWGEVQLKRVVELAGMTEHCDFTTQTTIQGDDGTLRPDLVVRLPGGGQIAVDAKAPTEDYMAAVGKPTEEERRAGYKAHAAKLREHYRRLSSRGYGEALGEGLELVVLFLPGESFLSAALQVEPELFDKALQKKVLLASPTNLIALLRAVAYGWRQERMAKHAREVSELGKELYERLRPFVNHLNQVGHGLKGAVTAFRAAVGSFERKVLPGARQLKEYGISASEDLPDLDGVEDEIREARLPRADSDGVADVQLPEGGAEE